MGQYHTLEIEIGQPGMLLMLLFINYTYTNMYIVYFILYTNVYTVEIEKSCWVSPKTTPIPLTIHLLKFSSLPI